MEVERDKVAIIVTYRRKNFTVEVPSDATVGVLGKQLSQATGVAISTMRLLLPKGKRVDPAKEPHSSSTLEASGITPVISHNPLFALIALSFNCWCRVHASRIPCTSSSIVSSIAVSGALG